MAQVDVVVNGRSYSLTCEGGQEQHLRDLAAHVDRKVSALAQSVGQIGEARLMLLAALLTTEEHLAAVQRLEAQAQSMVDLARSDETAAQVVDAAAKRVEHLTARLAAA